MSRLFQDNSETIGGTPLVKINNISDGNIYGKLENRNPAMSVKCRIGQSMVMAAEKDGSLKPGMTYAEVTHAGRELTEEFVPDQTAYTVGPFVFVAEDCPYLTGEQGYSSYQTVGQVDIIDHEEGHEDQSLILGPFYLPAVFTSYLGAWFLRDDPGDNLADWWANELSGPGLE